MPHSPVPLPSGAPDRIDRAGGPRLLVSVRDRTEAITAISAGVELLDVKDPGRGALGMATTDTLVAISSLLATVPVENRPLFSVACGELLDWAAAAGASDKAEALPQLEIPPDVVKFGAAGLISGRAAEWSSLLAAVDRLVGKPGESLPARVLVAYAEEEAVGAPTLEEAFSAVVDYGWDGLLVDTAQKRGGRLFDLQSVERLRQIRQRCGRAGVLFALAGRLVPDDLERIVAVGADIVGVRSAVCTNEDRSQIISRDRIVSLQGRLDTARRNSQTARR